MAVAEMLRLPAVGVAAVGPLPLLPPATLAALAAGPRDADRLLAPPDLKRDEERETPLAPAPAEPLEVSRCTPVATIAGVALPLLLPLMLEAIAEEGADEW
jgi:hypothetical protein